MDRLLLAQLPDPISRACEMSSTRSTRTEQHRGAVVRRSRRRGVVVGAAARNVLAGFSGALGAKTALGAGLIKMGAFVAVGAKAIALAGVVVAGRLFLSDTPPENLDDLTTALAEDALIGVCSGSLHGTPHRYDRIVAEVDGPARCARLRPEPGRSRGLLATEDELSRRTLRRLARKGTTRGAAAACRNLLLDEYLDVDLAARCKQSYESHLKEDGPRDLPAVTKEAKEPNLGDRARDVWLNVREFPVDLGRGLRERFSRDDDDGADADDEPDAAALLEEAARCSAEADDLAAELLRLPASLDLVTTPLSSWLLASAGKTLAITADEKRLVCYRPLAA